MDTYSIEVEYYGALKNMMKKGDISSYTSLADHQSKEHWYALGAVENLKGEIQIFDSKPFNTYAEGDSVLIDTSYNRNAALLVAAAVDSWIEVMLPKSIKNAMVLEKIIKQKAKDLNINIDKPFPFLIIGDAKTLQWHVIDWQEGDMEHTHEKHMTSGPHNIIQNQEVVIIGFYSESHKGIFTHHTSNMHLHMKCDSSKLAGHVDDFIPGDNMVLKLPAKPTYKGKISDAHSTN